MYIAAILSLVIAAIWAGVIHYGIEHTAKALCAGVFATCAALIVTCATISNLNPFDFSADWVKYSWGATAFFSFLALVLSKPALYLSFAWFIWFFALCAPVAEIQIQTGSTGLAYGAWYLFAMIPACVLAWKFRAHAKNWTLGGIGGAMVAFNVVYALLILGTQWFGSGIANFLGKFILRTAEATDAETTGRALGVIIAFAPIMLFGAGAFFGVRYAYKRSALLAASKI